MSLTVPQKFRKVYYNYVYWSPLPLLTPGEMIFFNAVMISLIAFTVYWSLVLLPPIIMHAMENLYYYITGNSMSFQFLASLLITKGVWKNYGSHTRQYAKGTNASVEIDNGSIKKLRSTLVKLFI